MPRLYLAGPDVFFPTASAHARAKQSICFTYGFDCFTPLDGETIPSDIRMKPADIAQKIFDKNWKEMQSCDICVANITPFRSVSADSGTILEIGCFVAVGKPTYGYTTTNVLFSDRVRESFPDDGMCIEDFGGVDNLMIDYGIKKTGGFIERPNTVLPYDSLETFERIIKHLANIR